MSDYYKALNEAYKQVVLREERFTLTPAYGRDYKSKAEVMKDFNDEKDFIIADFGSRWDGKPVNRQQMKPGDIVNIRYAKLRKILVHKIK